MSVLLLMASTVLTEKVDRVSTGFGRVPLRRPRRPSPAPLGLDFKTLEGISCICPGWRQKLDHTLCFGNSDPSCSPWVILCKYSEDFATRINIHFYRIKFKIVFFHKRNKNGVLKAYETNIVQRFLKHLQGNTKIAWIFFFQKSNKKKIS